MSCREDAIKIVKVNFIDRIIGRTINEKLDNYCHLNCLKHLKIKNIKRNGRWGFVPILGITEVFSSLFALLSLILMVTGFKKKMHNQLKGCPMAKLYYLQYYIANSAFLSSFMFHARETQFTRYADYFTAFASIVVGLLVSANRLVLLRRPSIFPEVSELTIRLGVVFFTMHVYKMAFYEFDYVYNKISCALIFFASCICNFTTFLYYREFSHSKQILYFLGCLLAAGGIEILDISPLFYLFDSHAVWHLLMALATPFYIGFISEDIKFQSLKKQTATKKFGKQNVVPVSCDQPDDTGANLALNQIRNKITHL